MLDELEHMGAIIANQSINCHFRTYVVFSSLPCFVQCYCTSRRFPQVTGQALQRWACQILTHYSPILKMLRRSYLPAWPHIIIPCHSQLRCSGHCFTFCLHGALALICLLYCHALDKAQAGLPL